MAGHWPGGLSGLTCIDGNLFWGEHIHKTKSNLWEHQAHLQMGVCVTHLYLDGLSYYRCVDRVIGSSFK